MVVHITVQTAIHIHEASQQTRLVDCRCDVGEVIEEKSRDLAQVVACCYHPQLVAKHWDRSKEENVYMMRAGRHAWQLGRFWKDGQRFSSHDWDEIKVVHCLLVYVPGCWVLKWPVGDHGMGVFVRRPAHYEKCWKFGVGNAGVKQEVGNFAEEAKEVATTQIRRMPCVQVC